MSYTIGNYVRLTVEFRDAAGTLVDPTSVECRVRAPAPAPVTLTPQAARSSLGTYIAEVLVDRCGIWAFRAVASGAVVAAVEGTFEVAPSVSDFST